jgi:secreted Zn-dependent insulinase-like peptidase
MRYPDNITSDSVTTSSTYRIFVSISTMPLDLSSLSDSDIVLLCHNPNTIISGDPDVRCLAKLSDEVIVKCGWSVTAEEAANQEYAYKYSSLVSDLKVPMIYRYFRTNNDIGYIVMELINGTSLEDKVDGPMVSTLIPSSIA